MQVDVIDAELLYPEPEMPRSPGIHVSTVLRMIAQENGYLKRELLRPEEFGLVDLHEKRNNDEWWASLPPDVQLKICMGLAWEQWYLPQLEGVLGHPGEMLVDGIY